MSVLGEEPPVVLRHARSERGEVVLRRRAEEGRVVHELITNGTFAMDSRETSSEGLLAAHAAVRPGARVLVGGLGLGYTAAALLDQPLERLVVVEIESCLVEWAEEGATDVLARVAADPRVELQVGDVHRVLSGDADTRPAPGWDAVVLDVDNGPDFLIHTANERLYETAALRNTVAALAPGGSLVLWCQGAHAGLHRRLRAAAGPEDRVAAFEHPVRREGRDFAYVVYVLTRSAATRGPDLGE